MKCIWLVLFSFVVSGCATTQVVFNPQSDINLIRKVAVIPRQETHIFSVTAGMWETDLLCLGFVVIDRGNIEAILEEQGLSLSGVTELKNTPKIAKILGVDALLIVDEAISFQKASGHINYGRVHMVNVNTGRVIYSAHLFEARLGKVLKEPLKKFGWNHFYRKISNLQFEVGPLFSRSPSFDQKEIRKIAILQSSQIDLLGPLLSVGYDVIEREALEKIYDEQKFSLSGILSSDDMKRIGKIYGIEGIIFSDEFKIDYVFLHYVKLVHIESGSVVWSISGIRPKKITTKLLQKLLQ